MTTEWTAATVERTEPERIAGERESLEQWLDFHRATLMTKCAGLTSDQLKARSVPPSALSLLGLVRHMTDVERGWFRMHAGGEQIEYLYSTDDNVDGDFDDLDDADPSSRPRDVSPGDRGGPGRGAGQGSLGRRAEPRSSSRANA